MGSQNSTPTLEGSTLAARRPFRNNNNESRQRKGRQRCDHCGKPGHVKENCWKLHRKPADGSAHIHGMTERRANAVTKKESLTSTETSPFTKEQLEALQRLLSQNLPSQSNIAGSGNSMIAHKGKLSKAFKVSLGLLSPWIIDSGASNHMTGN